jgi:hypothetical protein
VHLVEEPHAASAPGDAPGDAAVEIRGDQLQLSRATRFDARAIVSGRPAHVKGRGIDLEGPLVEFDRGRNRMTVDGAGRLKLPMSGGMNGLASFGMATAAAAPPPAAAGDQ